MFDKKVRCLALSCEQRCDLLWLRVVVLWSARSEFIRDSDSAYIADKDSDIEDKADMY